jgi:16S rRNA (adenine1518-N6/adenine1519-N6)-dimethyltransferase
LLGPAEIRGLAARLGITPTKALGQNFLHDPNTIRRIVRTRTSGRPTSPSRSVPGSARSPSACSPRPGT